jgi:hypothetical protein
LENSGIKSPALMSRMGSYVFAASLFLIVLACGNIIVVCAKKYKEKIKAMLEEKKKKFF